LKVSVIIPAYNESKIIGNSLKRLCNFFDAAKIDYEVIVCDDCSADETSEVVKNYATLNRKIIPLRFSKRIGKGGTIKNVLRLKDKNMFYLLMVWLYLFHQTTSRRPHP
jgi:glycosyltransferase involved in cell wall biosynthesis